MTQDDSSRNEARTEMTTTGGFLGWIERIGNRLPDPATLFLMGTLGIMVLSALAVAMDWSVTHELPRVVEGSDEVVWEVQYETTSVTLEDGTTEERDVPKVSRPTRRDVWPFRCSVKSVFPLQNSALTNILTS